jgi:hypothetical protein
MIGRRRIPIQAKLKEQSFIYELLIQPFAEGFGEMDTIAILSFVS